MEDYTIEGGTKYQLIFFYAEPPQYINSISIHYNNKIVPFEKNQNHIGKVTLPIDNNIQGNLLIRSALTSSSGHKICEDSINIRVSSDRK